MKKTKRLIFLLLIGFVIGGPFLVYDVFYGNPIRSILMEKETKKHLIKLGYNSNELLEVKAFYSMKKDTGIKRTRAHVIFKDEPEEKYVYIQYEKTKEIQQGCSYYNTETNAFESEYTEKRKHMVRDCINTVF